MFLRLSNASPNIRSRIGSIGDRFFVLFFEIVMWDWMNANSGAVQAFASIVNVLATLALVALTAAYVILTRRLATTTEKQLMAALEIQNALEKRAKRELSVLLRHFRQVLEELPWWDEELRATFPKQQLWTEEDIKSFQIEMTAIGPGSALLGRELAERLRWLLLVQSQSRSNADWSRELDADKYRHQVMMAKTNLLQTDTVLRNDAVKAYQEPFV
jgi:hypothetical protein